MKFSYQARTKTGQIQSGVVEASSREAALAVLQKYGLFVTVLTEKKPLFWQINLTMLEWVSRKDVVMFSRQLSIMFKSKVSLIEALKTLANQTKNQNFKQKILKIFQDIEGGTPFSKALSRYPRVFSPFYVAIIRSGEASGKLTESLDYLAEHLEREYKLIAGIRGAMIYPIFVIVVMLIVLIAMVIFVFPQLTDILIQSEQELPMITKIIIGFFDFLRVRGWILLIIGGGIIAGIWRAYKTPKGKKLFDKFLLRIPLVGGFLKKYYLARFAENLSTLVSGGLPIAKSLEITADVIGNWVYKQIITRTKEEVKKGEPISSVLSRYPDSFSPLAVQMVLVGEKTGTLDKTLVDIVNFYQEEVERSITSLLSILEPLLIVVLGLGVAVVMGAVFMPIYQMTGF